MIVAFTLVAVTVGRRSVQYVQHVLRFIRLNTPFLYAAAVFWLCKHLDKKASPKAKRAISRWLEPRAHNREALSNAILEVFDRIYTYPLLRLRAFLRSAIITIVITAIAVWEIYPFYAVGAT